jgi:hypothetical protein
MTATETLERKGHKVEEIDGKLVCGKCDLTFEVGGTAANATVYQAGRQGYDILACGYTEKAGKENRPAPAFVEDEEAAKEEKSVEAPASA